MRQMSSTPGNMAYYQNGNDAWGEEKRNKTLHIINLPCLAYECAIGTQHPSCEAVTHLKNTPTRTHTPTHTGITVAVNMLLYVGIIALCVDQ